MAELHSVVAHILATLEHDELAFLRISEDSVPPNCVEFVFFRRRDNTGQLVPGAFWPCESGVPSVPAYKVGPLRAAPVTRLHLECEVLNPIRESSTGGRELPLPSPGIRPLILYHRACSAQTGPRMGGGLRLVRDQELRTTRVPQARAIRRFPMDQPSTSRHTTRSTAAIDDRQLDTARRVTSEL